MTPEEETRLLAENAQLRTAADAMQKYSVRVNAEIKELQAEFERVRSDANERLADIRKWRNLAELRGEMLEEKATGKAPPPPTHAKHQRMTILLKDVEVRGLLEMARDKHRDPKRQIEWFVIRGLRKAGYIS